MQPTEASLNKFYDSSIMRIWENGKEDQKEVEKQKEKFSAAIEYLKEKKITSCLDVGCGNGWFLKWLKEVCDPIKELGLELSSGSVLKAREKGLKVYKNSLKEHYNISSLKYDAVTLWGCLEHVKDPKETIKMASHFLKPEGHLLICVPNIDCDEARKEKEKTYMFCPQHLWYFSEKTLINFMAKQGYELSFLYGFNSLYNIIGIFKQKFVKGRVFFNIGAAA